MGSFVLRIDENLKVTEENFGAYIKEGAVFVPSEVFALTTENYLGDDPVALAGFLFAFPLSLASLLNTHWSIAKEKSDKFILFLEENGMDIAGIRKASNRVTKRKYGALPPPAKQNLASLRCEACNKRTPRLSWEEIQTFQKEISGWRLELGPYLVKSFHFDDFAEPLAFVVKVGEVAEAEGHHPNISFGWRYAKISITTHAISGLSKNDFILAAKINELMKDKGEKA